MIEDGWAQARVAERLQVSRATVSKWVRRYRAQGLAGLADHSSKPHRSPSQTATRTEHRIIALRFTRRWGPHRIGYHLHLPQSTVSKVLNRYRMPLLGHIDLNTGLPVRKPKPVRYERENPGDLVHVDVKKLGRIPDGGGHRTLGRQAGRKNAPGSVIPSCTPRSTTTPGSSTPRSSPTRRKKPPPVSGSALTPSTPPTA